MATVLENVLAQYPNGEKCDEFAKELQNVQSLSWQDVYWKVKYIFNYGIADIEPAILIKFCNSCFTQGLTVSADKAKYMDARAMLARLYVLTERYDMCVNCIQAMLDITEDLPADVFLDLTDAELHTEAFRMILRNSKMFFNDLHVADNNSSELKERQAMILRNFLTLAGNYLADHPNEKVDIDTIQREVTIFGLVDSKEWKFFNDMKKGGTTKWTEPITHTVSIPKKLPDIVVPEDKPTETPPVPKKRPLEIPIGAVPNGETEDQGEVTTSEKIVTPIEEKPTVPEVAAPTVVSESSDGVDSINESANSDEHSGTLSPDMLALQEMLRSIQEMVAGNSAEIKKLKRQRTAVRKKNEDTSGIEAQLAESERRSKELQEKLAEAEGALATSEAQKRTLATRVKAQDALLEKKKAMEFTEEELAALEPYSAIIIFDTCSIMNYPNILDFVRDGELVVVPKQVNEELENHKTNHYDSQRQVKARRAIDAIFQYKRKYPITYADHIFDLIPEAYRAESGAKEINDNKILSVAVRYRRFSNKPVYFIVDDKSLSNKASGEDIDVYTGEEFTEPEYDEYDDEEVVTTEEGDIDESTFDGEDDVVDEEDPEEIAAKEARKKAAQEEFLAQKITATNLKLESSSISFLQNNGVKTIADFLSHTEESFSQMKSKKGMPYPAKWVKVQESLRRKLEAL